MFGFSPLVERLVWVVLVGLFVVLTVWYERRQGAVGCELANTKVATQQIAHNTVIEGQDKAIVKTEGEIHAQAVAAPVARPVTLRVCPPTPRRAVSEAPTPGPVSDGASPLPGPSNGAPVQGESIGPELQAVGRDADAQIVELQDYITRVCSVR